MKFTDFIKKFTLKEREKKHLNEFLEKKKRFLSMTKDELEMHYMKICTEYEHKKNVFLTIIGTIFISILSNVWTEFFKLVKSLFIYMNNPNTIANEAEITKTALIITFSIAGAFFLISFVIIFDYLKCMKNATENKILIERLINDSND